MNSTMLLERIEEAVSQIDSDIHEYSGDIFVDITEVIDTLHTVFVTDETGFPFSVVGWSNVKSVCENLSQKIDRIFCNFKKDYISKVEQLVTQKTDKVQNVFLVSRFVGLHLCAIHRMALMGKVTTNVYKKT